MSLLDNLGKKIGSAAETTATKAKEQVEIAKLNSAISADEKKIEKLYTDIGRLVFEAEKDSAEPYQEMTGQILALQSSIEQNRQKIALVKEPGKQNETEPASPGAAPNACPSCGAANSDGTRFCGECGAKLQ